MFFLGHHPRHMAKPQDILGHNTGEESVVIQESEPGMLLDNLQVLWQLSSLE